ncbi:MAG: glucose-6-phosphate isomerase [bacterium]
MSLFATLQQSRFQEQLKKYNTQKAKLCHLLTPQRLSKYVIYNRYLAYYYATNQIETESLQLFQEITDELQVIPRYQALLSGQRSNISENRQVNHHKTRSQDRGFYGEQQARIADFAKKVHQGKIHAPSGKPFKHLILIGIGGSYLSVEAFYEALNVYAVATDLHCKLTIDFVANIDPLDLAVKLQERPFDQTLFLVISKSGSTQEIAENITALETAAQKQNIDQETLAEQSICVTCEGSPLDNPARFCQRFYIDDAIGGRYSLTSAVGILPLSLRFGSSCVEAILTGAFSMDKAAKNPDITQNMALLDAFIGIWEHSFLGYQSKAIIPYSTALHRFPAHLQQLICESNGKSVLATSEALAYTGSPLIFGEPGTQAQHSFFQQLHQGKEIVPIQFIGFKETLLETSAAKEAHQKLNTNMLAQMMALALGKESEDPNQHFPGNRPSTLLLGRTLSPEALGAMLAFYENKTMFEGFLLGINSFDQPGVQLGKKLCQRFLEEEDLNPLEKGFCNLLE